jgi:putative hydrolase of the HAD superfamily
MPGGRGEPVRAVFFDAGETLLSPDPSFPELFARVVGEGGHDLDLGRVHQVVSASSAYFTELFRSEEGRLWSTSPERSRAMWDAVYRHFLRSLGVREEEHEALIEALYRRFTDVSSYRLHADVRPLLDRLAASDLVVGMISNFEEWLARLLEHLEVAHLFDVTVISGTEGVEKPDPKIFRIALDRAGVEARASVYVGDHPILDIEGAQAVGMRAVLIDRRDRYPEVDAERISSLEDLPAATGISLS